MPKAQRAMQQKWPQSLQQATAAKAVAKAEAA
jgi:hypothetical protein